MLHAFVKYVYTYIHVCIFYPEDVRTYHGCIFTQGGMVLNKASDVISLPDEKGKLYRFVVTCGMKGRAFEIKAPDQRTKSEWMHAIKEVCTYICT